MENCSQVVSTRCSATFSDARANFFNILTFLAQLELEAESKDPKEMYY
jgi:hypothetical protein